jgi:quercetin dioxygenase-like cupin family protein
MYTIEKDGHTNLDQHQYEHQVYVLKGHGILRKKGVDIPLRPGDAVFIAANSPHQFVNQNNEPLVYLLSNMF